MIDSRIDPFAALALRLQPVAAASTARRTGGFART